MWFVWVMLAVCFYFIRLVAAEFFSHLILKIVNGADQQPETGKTFQVEINEQSRQMG